jgi:hypothetical protein
MPYGVVNADLMTTSDGVSSSGLYGFKNRLINSAMVIDQRNAGALINPMADATYYLDRWRASATQTSKLSIGQNAGSVTPPAGFTNYMGFTSLSAYSITSGDIFGIAQNIEGFNVADLGWGTANAQAVTLSFWVRSSLTGTFGGSFRNSASSRSYPISYTISSANTWEQKSITVAGDTSGTWLTTNGIGILLFLSLGSGSTYSGTAGSWSGSVYTSATGATSVVGTNGATFYITGVQLEKGSTATSFDYRPYGTELALCQRYCYKIATSGGYSAYATTGMFISTTRVDFPILLPTYMRASPTATYTAANTYLPSSAGTDFTPSAVATAAGSASPQAITVSFTVSGATAGRAATLTDLNSTASNMIFSAEL